MRRIILLPVASLAGPYFSTLSYKGNDFRERVIERKMYVLILSETFLRSIKRDTIIKVYWFSCKVPLFLLDINETGILSTDFRKILKHEISENPRAELLHADGRTDGQT